MADSTRPTCLDPECIIPISRHTTEVFKTGTWTSVRPRFAEKISPCRVACPVGNNIVAAARAAAQGDFDTALAVFLEESPLPGVCGRVCYRPCETVCNRKDLDKEVRVRALERAAADLGQAQPKRLSKAGEDKPVVVVGSGPAGLACAYHLARMGHPVTLLETAEQAGGLLSRGIPGFRLPVAALKKDIERIWQLPVSLHTGRMVDRKALNDLVHQYGAVFLASGADRHRPLGVIGENLPGVVQGLDFLRSNDLQNQARGADVVVIGGGNTALDAARMALRAGARRVSVLYRRTQEQMPAFADEVAEGGAEGVEIDALVAPIAFLGNADKLEAVRLIEQRLGPPGTDGRPRPVPIDGAERELTCDLAIIAAGQHPDPEPLLHELRWEDGRVWVNGWGGTSLDGLFAGGDLTPARASVVDAMASGKRASLGIHLSLTGNRDRDVLETTTLGPGPAFSLTACFQRPESWRPEQVASPDQLTLCFVEPKSPQELPETEPEERVRTGCEAALGLSGSQAVEEADRCLCCGTCVGCDRCYTFCPDGAVIPPHRPGEAYTPQDDYCKGCSICASVCVRGVMEPGEEQ